MPEHSSWAAWRTILVILVLLLSFTEVRCFLILLTMQIVVFGYEDAWRSHVASAQVACVAGVRRGREKGSSSAKRDLGIGRVPPPPILPRPPTPTIALRARTPLLPSPSNAGHAGYCTRGFNSAGTARSQAQEQSKLRTGTKTKQRLDSLPCLEGSQAPSLNTV